MFYIINTVRTRRGSAPLELVIALPMIAGMVALIMNAGAAGVATSDAVIAARVDAFHNAEQHSTDSIRLFMLAPEIAANDITAASATRDRSVPPILGSSTLSGQATLAVMGNVWNRRELPLNDPVHMTLMAQVAGNGAAGQALGPIGDAIDGFRNAGDQGRKTQGEIQQKGKELNEESDAIKEAKQKEAAQRQANRERTAQLEKDGAAERAEIAKLNQQIKEQDQARDKAREDLKDDKPALEKKEAEIAEKKKSLEADRKTHEEKLKRIDGEISLLKAGT